MAKAMANPKHNKSFMSFFSFSFSKSHHKPKPKSVPSLTKFSDYKNDVFVKSAVDEITDSPSRQPNDFEESIKVTKPAAKGVYGEVEGRRSVDIHCNDEGMNDRIVKLLGRGRVQSGLEEKERRGYGVVEGRRSVSRVETNMESVAAFLAVKVIAADMPGLMQAHAFRCARLAFDSLEKFSPKHMAFNIKKEFDKGYGPAWHCIVGSSFGSFVTHSTGCFLYFSIEKLCVLVFRTKVQRAVD